MTRLTATAKILAALTRKTEERAKIRARQEAEREARRIADEADAVRRELDAQERAATRAHITATVGREVWQAVINGEDHNSEILVTEVERGPTKLLVRDGLLWLVEKRRINAAQRMAGERYRSDYADLHHGGMKSCLDDTPGARFVSTELLPTLQHASARESLNLARRKGLVNDNTLIWLADEVAGKGTTLREIAAGDKHRAADLETELGVALRLLARHYGYLS